MHVTLTETFTMGNSAQAYSALHKNLFQTLIQDLLTHGRCAILRINVGQRFSALFRALHHGMHNENQKFLSRVPVDPCLVSLGHGTKKIHMFDVNGIVGLSGETNFLGVFHLRCLMRVCQRAARRYKLTRPIYTWVWVRLSCIFCMQVKMI